MKYKVIWGQGASVRVVPSIVNNTALSVLPKDAVIDVLENGIADREAPNDPGKKWVKTVDGNYVAEIYYSQVRLDRIPDPDPLPGGVQIARAVVYDEQGNVIAELFVK
jgi:hypothetical protein